MEDMCTRNCKDNFETVCVEKGHGVVTVPTYYVNVDKTDDEIKSYPREQLQRQFEIQLL
jgi:hypothetical protein